MAINAAVMVSTMTAFCIMPASKASMPTFFMRAITMSRVSRSAPTTKTSVSIFSSNFSSCSGLMFWNASTTLLVSPKNVWISTAMDPAGLILARLFFSASSELAMLMMIFPAAAGLMSSRIGFMPSYGTASRTMSAFAVASRLV